jgi:hypothetical protein
VSPVRSPSYIIAVAFGITIAVLLAPVAGVLHSHIEDRYDKAFPVARVKAVRLPSAPGEILLTMETHKLRNCELLSVSAYDRAADGSQVRTRIEKLSEGRTLQTIPAGEVVRSALWRVFPVTGTSIVVWAEHTCGDRVVRTRLFQMGTGAPEDQ